MRAESDKCGPKGDPVGVAGKPAVCGDRRFAIVASSQRAIYTSPTVSYNNHLVVHGIYSYACGSVALRTRITAFQSSSGRP